VLDSFSEKKRGVEISELQSCLESFSALIDRRNALIHAHPITHKNGNQILAFQAHAGRPIPEMTWDTREVEKLICLFDAAAVTAGGLLDRLRK
jgi:hypothetical protein